MAITNRKVDFFPTQMRKQLKTQVNRLDDRVDTADTNITAANNRIDGEVVNATAATLAVTAASHAGRVINLNRAAGIAVTLPAATGTGHVFRFVVGTTITSNSTTIKVANATDTMVGTALLFADGGDTTLGFATAADSDTVTMNGTTTGGIAGAEVLVVDLATNKYFVKLVSDASGTEATPFSATVS